MAGEIEERLEKSVEVGTLYAFYGSLLTPRQQEALGLYYDEDLSLGEIAAQMAGSRQNVHELITRSTEKLRHYEQALGLVRKAAQTSARLREIRELLDRQQWEEARQALIELEETQEGEESHGL